MERDDDDPSHDDDGASAGSATTAGDAKRPLANFLQTTCLRRSEAYAADGGGG